MGKELIIKNPPSKGNGWRRSLGLFVLMAFLAACQKPPAASDTPTQALTPSLTATQSITDTPTVTPLPTLTPEPAWYQGVDPSYGALRFQYAEVLNKKARVYASFDDAVAKNGNFGYLPNFPAYVAYTDTRKGSDGETYYLENYGWMAGADLSLLIPSKFSGILLTRPVDFRFGWLLADAQSVNAAGEPVRAYQRYDVIHEVPAAAAKDGFISVGVDEWLPVASVALTSTQIPADVAANTCRFIYVNLTTQILTVFNNCKLVFATLISSGKNSWTFTGSFAILNKWEYYMISSPDWSTSDFYIERVPFFMNYAGDFGFHGAYWHDDFGSAGSHGCINLSPTDAGWLFAWAGTGERVIISAGK